MRQTVRDDRRTFEWQEPDGVPMLIGDLGRPHPACRVAFTCRLGGVSEPPYDSLNLSDVRRG